MQITFFESLSLSLLTEGSEESRRMEKSCGLSVQSGARKNWWLLDQVTIDWSQIKHADQVLCLLVPSYFENEKVFIYSIKYFKANTFRPIISSTITGLSPLLAATCERCRLPFDTSEVFVNTQGKTWHKECFRSNVSGYFIYETSS